MLSASLLAAWLALAPPGARAADWASGFAELAHSRVRLLAGPALADGTRLVGVQIQLDPGWHTYWRHPGDSGVPPVFDWSGSRNFRHVETRWPAPRPLKDPYGTSIGYIDEVVFPVRIAAPEPAAPVELRLGLDYAACAEICIPLSATLAMTLPPGSPPPALAGLVARYDAEVPPQEAAADGPAVLRAWPERGEDGLMLMVEARGHAPASAFVEGPARFYFAPAEARQASGGRLVFAVAVEGAKAASDLAGAAVTATVVAADGAVEHSWTIE